MLSAWVTFSFTLARDLMLYCYHPFVIFPISHITFQAALSLSFLNFHWIFKSETFALFFSKDESFLKPQMGFWSSLQLFSLVVMSKAKVSDKQTQDTKETFCCCFWFLSVSGFAVLRGERCISNASALQHPPARQRRQSSPPGMAFFLHPVTCGASGSHRGARAPHPSRIQQDNIPKSISGEL